VGAQVAVEREGEEVIGAERALEQLSIGNWSYDPAGAMRLGPLEFHVYGEQKFIYDDNIYLLGGRERREDVISSSRLGARVDLRLKKIGGMSLGYYVLINEYLKRSKPDNISHGFTFNIDLSLLFETKKKRKGVYFRVGVDYRKSRDPINIQFSNLFERDDFLFWTAVGARFNKLGIELRYYYRMFDYDRPEFNAPISPLIGATQASELDHEEHHVVLEASWALTPKMDLFAGGEYTYVNYEKHVLNDYDWWGLYVGLRRQITEKIGFYLRGGYLIQNSTRSGALPDESDASTGYGYASITYKPWEKTEFSISYQRSVDFSGTSNYQIVDRGDAEIVHGFTQKLRGRLFGFAERADPTETPSFYRYGGGGGINYLIRRWLAVGAEYDYVQRKTRIPEGSYYRNRVCAFVTVNW
jgi:hypothetical protein